MDLSIAEEIALEVHLGNKVKKMIQGV